MKIELQSPFKEDYKSGYLLTNKEPRNLVSLVRNDNHQTSVSYARYLMSCKLGRYLSKEEQVDHIDNNKLNDVIENLQILSAKDNTIKKFTSTNRTRKMLELKCPNCGISFIRELRNCHPQKGSIFTSCSRKCLYNFLKKGLSKEQLISVGKNQVIREFRK